MVTAIRRLLCSASEDVGLAYPQAGAHREGLCGQRPPAGPAGGAAAPGGGGHPAGHLAQVQQRLSGHRRGAGGRAGRPGGDIPGSSRTSTQTRRDRSGSRATATPRLSGPLGPAAVSAGQSEKPEILPVRRQQDGAGRPPLLGGDQSRGAQRAPAISGRELEETGTRCASRHTSPPTKGRKPMEAIRILVVEDDPDINQLLCTIMSDAGYQCQPAFSGSEAMLWAERERFDLVLLDLMPPASPERSSSPASAGAGPCPSSSCPPRRGWRTRSMSCGWGGRLYPQAL